MLFHISIINQCFKIKISDSYMLSFFKFVLYFFLLGKVHNICSSE